MPAALRELAAKFDQITIPSELTRNGDKVIHQQQLIFV